MPEYRQHVKERKRKRKERLLVLAAALLFIAGAVVYAPAALSVSQNLSKTGSQTSNSQVSAKELPIYSVQTDKKQVALSFDAAWGNEDTSQILSILEKYQVKVTFFMTGSWISKYPDDVKDILAAGHDLGNHSNTHPNMSKLSTEQMKEEIQATHQKVKDLTGYEMTLFRPPYGDYNDAVVNAVKDCGYYCIQWDVDSLDWKNYGVESLIKTVCNHKNLGNGSIVLMHNGGKYTAQALESVITGLQSQGYELVPISQLIIKDNYHMDHTGRQIADSPGVSESSPETSNETKSN